MAHNRTDQKKQIIYGVVAVVLLGLAGLRTYWFMQEQAGPTPPAPRASTPPDESNASRQPDEPNASELIDEAVAEASAADEPIEPREVPDVPTVALMDFVSDDGHYRSGVRCREVTAAVQALAADAPKVKWVERDQLNLARRELNLLPLGASGSGGSTQLRLGRWVEADLMVRGRLITDTESQRRLRLEVIDLYHADVLASRTVMIDGQAPGAVRFTEDHAQRITDALTAALKEARRNLRAASKQRAIAPLFLRNMSATGRLDFLEIDLLDGLEERMQRSEKARLLRFPRPEQALGEAELALLGLTDADPRAWQQLADVYVWGSYREKTGKDDGESGEAIPFDQLEVELRLSIWDGRSEVRTIQHTATVGRIDAVIDRLAERLIEDATQETDGPPSPKARRAAAAKLLERAKQARSRWDTEANSNNDDEQKDPQAVAARQYRLRLLESAALFAPRSAEIRRRMLKARYGSTIMLDRFDRGRDALQSYTHYLEMFGEDGSAVTRLSGLRGYSGALAETLDYSNNRNYDGAVPMDMPDAAIRRLHQRLIENLHRLIDRLKQWKLTAEPDYLKDYGGRIRSLFEICMHNLEAPRLQADLVEAMWPLMKPVYVHAVRERGFFWHGQDSVERQLHRLFARVERTDRLFAMLEFDQQSEATDAAAKSDTQSSEDPPIPERLVQRAREADRRAERVNTSGSTRRNQPDPGRQSAQEGDNQKEAFSFTVADVPPIEAPMRSFGFDRDEDAEQRFEYRREWMDQPVDLVTIDGTLWIAVRHQSHDWERVNRKPEPRLYVHDPAGDRIVDLGKSFDTRPRINDMLVADDAVWLATEGTGVWRIEPRSAAITRFTGEDGVLSPKMRRIVRGNGRLLFKGAASKLNYFDLESGNWGDLTINLRNDDAFTVADGRLVTTGSQAQRIDLETGDQTKLAEVFAEHWGVPTEGDILKIQPRFRQLPERLQRSVRWTIRATAHDGSDFWLATPLELIRYNASEKSAERWPLPGIEPEMMRADQRGVWVVGTSRTRPKATEDEAHTVLLRWDTKAAEWAGALALSGKVTCMTLGPRRLWLGRSGTDEPIVEIHRPALPSMPEIAEKPAPGPRRAEQDGEAPASSPTRPEGITPLMHAAYRGDVEAVRQLIEQGAEINAITERGWTALCAGVRGGDAAMVRFLLEQGAATRPALESHRERRTLPLIEAAALNRTQIIDLLIDHGAEPNATEDRRRSPIFAAVRAGHLAALRRLIEHGASPQAQEFSGWTPLMHAAAHGSPEMVRLLVEAGSVLEATEPAIMRFSGASGRTPLLIAVDRGRPGIVRALLEADANPDAVNRRGQTGLARAVKRGDAAMARLLLEEGADPDVAPSEATPLMIAAKEGDAEMVELLLEHGADPAGSYTVPSSIGSVGDVVLHHTALSYAADEGHLRIMNRLMEAGLTPDTPIASTSAGVTALCQAAYGGETAALARLLKAGVNIDATDPNGMTALMWAASQGREAAAYYLLDAGADPTPRDRKGRTAGKLANDGDMRELIAYYKPAEETGTPARLPRNPHLRPLALIHAVEQGQTQRVAALLEGDADANYKRLDGWPMLTIAAAKGHKEVAALLLEHGAAVGHTGPGGWTALMQAAGRGHPQIVRLLLDHGAKVLAMNPWGTSALDLARERDHDSVLAMLEETEAARQDGRLLINAVEVMEAHAVSVLLENGTAVDGIDAQGRTALFHLFMEARSNRARQVKKRKAILEVLIEQGATIDHRDDRGRTPLMTALEKRVSSGEIRMLLEAGARVDAKDGSGTTPLKIARKAYRGSGRNQVISMLKAAQSER